MTTNLHQLPDSNTELLGDALPPLVLVSLVSQGAPDTLGMLSFPRTYGRNSSTTHLPLLPRKLPRERNSLGTPTTSWHILTLTGTHPAKEAVSKTTLLFSRTQASPWPGGPIHLLLMTEPRLSGLGSLSSSVE